MLLRRSTAGTIAASTPRNQPGTRPPAPAAQWRAPLRHELREPVRPRGGAAPAGQRRAPLRRPPGPVVRPHLVAAPAGQWRAPLRLAAQDQAGDDEHLLPPVNGGPHCGNSFAPTATDSSAAAPRGQRRAPLRPFPGDPQAGVGVPAPAVNGGSIAASSAPWAST